VSVSNSSLDIIIEPKAKDKYRAAAMLLFGTLNNYLNKIAHFSKIYHHTTFQNLTLGSVSIAPLLMFVPQPCWL
jgi:hypothetical protein